MTSKKPRHGTVARPEASIAADDRPFTTPAPEIQLLTPDDIAAINALAAIRPFRTVEAEAALIDDGCRLGMAAQYGWR